VKKFKAAIIGLGNIGFRFNLDPLRRGVWSHAAAYDTCKWTNLCAAVETDRRKSQNFTELCRDRVPVFSTIKELMKNVNPDIVSVCTPTYTHYSIVKEMTSYPIKAIFCEKPIADTAKETEEMINLCKRKGILLVVNYTRRWQMSYLTAKRIVESGKIGKITSVNGFYPAQVFNIGTHLFDVVRFIISKDPCSAYGVSLDSKMPDPDISGSIVFTDGIVCTINVLGRRENLVFEVDIIGTKGRVRVTENGLKVELAIFAKSRDYSGYQELFPVPIKVISGKDRFVEAVDDIVKVLAKKKNMVNCSGKDGLIALKMSKALLDSAKNGFMPVKIGI
jgi:predicted dehydrogenase